MSDKPARNKTGRPFALTPEVQKIILENVAAGATLKDAAGAAGVSYDAIADARHRPEFVGFCQALTHAEASLRCRVAASLADHEDWRAKAWYIERRDREQWGKRETLEHEFPDTKGKTKAELVAELAAIVRKAEGGDSDGGDE